MPQHTIDSLIGSALASDDLTLKEKPTIPIMLAMPPIAGSPYIQTSISTSVIAPSFCSSLNFNFDGLISGVIPSKVQMASDLIDITKVYTCQLSGKCGGHFL